MDKKIEQIADQVTVSTQDVANKMKQMLGRDLTALEIGIIEMQVVTNHAIQAVIQEKHANAQLLGLIKSGTLVNPV